MHAEQTLFPLSSSPLLSSSQQETGASQAASCRSLVLFPAAILRSGAHSAQHAGSADGLIRSSFSLCLLSLFPHRRRRLRHLAALGRQFARPRVPSPPHCATPEPERETQTEALCSAPLRCPPLPPFSSLPRLPFLQWAEPACARAPTFRMRGEPPVLPAHRAPPPRYCADCGSPLMDHGQRCSMCKWQPPPAPAAETNAQFHPGNNTCVVAAAAGCAAPPRPALSFFSLSLALASLSSLAQARHQPTTPAPIPPPASSLAGAASRPRAHGSATPTGA